MVEGAKKLVKLFYNVKAKYLYLTCFAPTAYTTLLWVTPRH